MADVQYTPNAAPGKQCQECKFFNANPDGATARAITV